MKRYISMFLAAVTMLFAVGCGEGNVHIDSGIVGQWHLSSWNGQQSEDLDIWFDFREDGSFDLYQKYGTSVFERLSGTFSVDGNVLYGSYNDGAAWSNSYNFELGSGDNQLTLTTISDNPETGVYTRGTIPADVLNSPGVKSAPAAEYGRWL